MEYTADNFVILHTDRTTGADVHVQVCIKDACTFRVRQVEKTADCEWYRPVSVWFDCLWRQGESRFPVITYAGLLVVAPTPEDGREIAIGTIRRWLKRNREFVLTADLASSLETATADDFL